MGRKNRRLVTIGGAIVIALLLGACSKSEGGRWREPEISGAWSKPDSKLVILTIDDGGACDDKVEVTNTENPEAVMVALRFHERKTPPPCPAIGIGYRVPFELKEPLGSRKLLEPTAHIPKPLTAEPGDRYKSIPVQVISKS
jgi:hypothetical protein